LDKLHIGVARGGQRSHVPPKFLEHAVILYFEGRFSKQNGVILLKSDILPPRNFFATPKFLGWLRNLTYSSTMTKKLGYW